MTAPFVLLALASVLAACANGDGGHDADAAAQSDAPATETPAPPDVPGSDAAPIDAPATDGASSDAAVDVAPMIDTGPHQWALGGYCGASVDAGCPTTDPCPTTFDGGVSARPCGTTLARCITPEAAGVASKVFVCIPSGASVWDLNGICGMMDCTGLDAAACPPSPTGFACSPDLSRCAGGSNVYVCLPGNATVWMFDGYCGTPGTAACDTTLPVCTAVGTSTAGAPCAPAFTRCLGGNKLFVCAPR